MFNFFQVDALVKAMKNNGIDKRTVELIIMEAAVKSTVFQIEHRIMQYLESAHQNRDWNSKPVTAKAWQSDKLAKTADPKRDPCR